MKRNPSRSGTKSLADELTELRALDPPPPLPHRSAGPLAV